MKMLFLFAALASILLCQTPNPLERHFQGLSVTVLLDLPGDESGVDVDLARQAAVKEDQLSARLRKYGIAIRRGQNATLTLVKVKGDHIEFQLDGGGFTDLQLFRMPGYDSSHWGFTEEERKLRYRISGTSDKDRKKRLESDYDRLRRRRIEPLREQLERERRAQNGSRLNIRLASNREAARVNLEELISILRPYVKFR